MYQIRKIKNVKSSSCVSLVLQYKGFCITEILVIFRTNGTEYKSVSYFY